MKKFKFISTVLTTFLILLNFNNITVFAQDNTPLTSSSIEKAIDVSVTKKHLKAIIMELKIYRVLQLNME